jgi:hypothetical protein
MSRRLGQATAVVLDLAWIALSAVVLSIIVSGGGEYRWAGHLIRMHSVENPLVAWQVVALIRLMPLQTMPFLLQARWPLDRLTTRCLAWCRGVGLALQHTTWGQARRALWLVIVVVTLVKLANAALYPGFFSGDDVEIHEMTFAALFGWRWSAWDLRNALYPMAFIYPVQALLVRVGVDDTAVLVLAGRVVVALLSSITLWLVFRAGSKLKSPGVGLVAALLLGVHRLYVTFGGSELPRPVASVFIVGAFLCLLETPLHTRRALLAGILLGIGGALRFGELAFVLPAAAVAYGSGKGRAALAVVVSSAVVAGLVLGASDLWYWGSPLHSTRKVIEFTLIDRLSSRGYQPPWYYLTALTSWTSVAVAGLAVYAAQRSTWRVTLWWALPIFMLSLLPHKEPRYLVAVLPFVCLAAALGLGRALRTITERPMSGVRSRTLAAVLVIVCAGGLLLEIGGWRFGKPSGPVELARVVNASGCAGGVAVEHLWRVGGRLYLRDCGFAIDLDREVVASPGALEDALASPPIEWVLLRRPVPDAVRAVLPQDGFTEVLTTDPDYLVGRRPPAPGVSEGGDPRRHVP